MSDITPELIEAHKRRDARYRLIDEGIQVGAEIRDSAVIRCILRNITQDADRAMEELSEVSPLDNVAVAKHLVKIQTLVYIRRVLKDVQDQAALTAREVAEEDQPIMDEY